MQSTRKSSITVLSTLLLTATVTTAQQNTPDATEQFFKATDANADGVITIDEVPVALKSSFPAADADGDGKITLEEAKAFDKAIRLRETLRERTNRSATDRHAETVRILRDIDYVGDENPRQSLDLYIPRTARVDGDLPLVVFVHGGGWRQGNKNQAGQQFAELASSGRFACACIGYRLTDEATWPAQIHDCKAAIRWLRANASSHGIDPDRIAVWGASAGGQLVAILGTTSDTSEMDGALGEHTDVSSRVSCVVDYFGTSEHRASKARSSSQRSHSRSPALRLLLGGDPAVMTEAARTSSPMAWVTEEDVPFLIVHGTEDRTVPVEHSKRLDAALDKAGVDSKLVLIEGAGHGQFRDPKVMQIVMKYLDQQLHGQKSDFEDIILEAMPPDRQRGRSNQGRNRRGRPGSDRN